MALALGVSTSALYRWVADRDALLDLVGERMAARLTPDWEPDRESWRRWLREGAHRVRDELGHAPGHALGC